MKKYYNRLIFYFLKGLPIILPFSITVYLTWYTICKINIYLSFFIEHIPFLAWSIKIPGMSMVFAFLVITITGYIGSAFFVAPLISSLETVIFRIPIINILYSYIKESTFAFIEKLDKPVMVKIRNQDCEVYKLGFLTQEKLHALSLHEGEVAVYLPHAYAFSGEVTIFPKKDVKLLDIPSTDVLRLILTGGLAEIKRPLMSAEKKR